MGLLKYLSEATAELTAMGEEFALIPNPVGVFPPAEIVPLGPKFQVLDGPPSAIFVDMDGTLTNTEPLFLHQVEEVVRNTTGWHRVEDWAGIDPERDYPNIVGFSTQRNLEYLYPVARDAIRPALFFSEAVRAFAFLAKRDMPADIVRRIRALATVYGIEAEVDQASAGVLPAPLVDTLARRYPNISQEMFAHFGLLIFYADYIDILERVIRGDGAEISRRIHGDASVPAVNAMPGVALLFAVTQGWLAGEETTALAAHLADPAWSDDERARAARHLARAAMAFHGGPCPVALVTSSGIFESRLVLQAVFRAVREEVSAWPIGEGARARILAGTQHPETFFSTVVTCDDVGEMRIKPWRDPYNLALARLGMDATAARSVIGFEDTEVGITAQRGAGVGIPCAVPLEFTRNQDFQGAAHVLHGGMLEAVLRHGLFLAP